MKIAVPKEADPIETRVAATPETVKKYIGLGAEVAVQAGAGEGSRITDAEYEAAGAKLAKTAAATVKDADIVLKVRRPSEAELKGYKAGALVIAAMDPYGNEAALKAMADAGVVAFAMELLPRITRAQTMDVLSSQANLAGYQAVIDAAENYGRALPMMMTAAGTVPAARVFVMGAGVAGLQAIATARRLGAVVTATDVRPAAKEQVQSLGAKFIAVEDEEFKQAETTAGYAKPMSAEYQAKQAALVADHIKKQDIVITTALIPGRPAPKLVTKEMVASMRPGSVLVDLAVERGGNVEGVVPGQVANVGDVKIIGYFNVPGRIAASASALYARNLYAFVETLIDKSTKALAIDWNDELVKATDLTRDGKIVHPAFSGETDMSPEEALAAAHAAAETAKTAAETAKAAAIAAQTYADQVAEATGAAVHAASGGAIDPFVFRLSIFVLAIFVGYYVVWSVTPALHTPLMSVTNAISSVIVVGALLAVSVGAGEAGGPWWARALGFVALTLVSVNIFGGFMVTQRMLAMYRKRER